MKLYNFFLAILSFGFALSAPLPAPGSCSAVNEDDGTMRMASGAGVSLFSNQVRINIVDSLIEPSTSYPWGGFTVSIHNDYCLTISVTFHLPNGESYDHTVSAYSSTSRALIPHRVPHGDVVHVSIADHL